MSSSTGQITAPTGQIPLASERFILVDPRPAQQTLDAAVDTLTVPPLPRWAPIAETITLDGAWSIPAQYAFLLGWDEAQCRAFLNVVCEVELVYAFSRATRWLVGRISIADSALVARRTWSVSKTYQWAELRSGWTTNRRFFSASLARMIMLGEAAATTYDPRVVRVRDGDRMNTTRGNLTVDATKYTPIGHKIPDTIERGIHLQPASGKYRAIRIAERAGPVIRRLGDWPLQRQAIAAYHLDQLLQEREEGTHAGIG